jgi:SAM-dependent methyltransferase
MQAVVTPVRDDAREFRTFDRGMYFVEALNGLDIPVQGRRVADLGTGFGSIAIAMAKVGAAHVLAVDAHPDRVREVTARAREAGVSLETAQVNLLQPVDPSLANSFQVALLIGVVEYAGLWDLDESVEALQQRVLEHAYQLLDTGGTLILGTKNRLWPRYAVRDAHTRRPLVNALPRRWADRLSRRLDGGPYRQHIHSPAGWERVLRAVGFRAVTCYYPYFSYQFPVRTVAKPGLNDLRILAGQPVPPEVARTAIGRLWLPKALLMIFSSTLGMPMSGSLIIKAEK